MCYRCKYMRSGRDQRIGVGFCRHEDSDCYMDRVFKDESCDLYVEKMLSVSESYKAHMENMEKALEALVSTEHLEVANSSHRHSYSPYGIDVGGHRCTPSHIHPVNHTHYGDQVWQTLPVETVKVEFELKFPDEEDFIKI